MEHASYWYEFAYELNLDEEYLDTLDNDELSLSNEEKFERAIKEWIENGDDVSWEKIIAVTGGEVINLPTQRLERGNQKCLSIILVNKTILFVNANRRVVTYCSV